MIKKEKCSSSPKGLLCVEIQLWNNKVNCITFTICIIFNVYMYRIKYGLYYYTATFLILVYAYLETTSVTCAKSFTGQVNIVTKTIGY